MDNVKNVFMYILEEGVFGYDFFCEKKSFLVVNSFSLLLIKQNKTNIAYEIKNIFLSLITFYYYYFFFFTLVGRGRE